MAFWDRKPEAAPEPPAPPAPEPDKIDRLADAVHEMAEAQLRQATPAPAPQYAPPPPPINDISDDDLDQVYERGTASDIRKANDIRRAADAERLRREMGAELNQFRTVGLAQLNQLTKRETLRENPYYHKDTAFKKDVDALVGQVETSGAMLTGEALDWILQKVTGQHHSRLLAEHTEAEIRRQRENPPGKSTNPAMKGLPPDLAENYGLGPDQDHALAHLNGGRGRTADEFAAELPPRRINYNEVVDGRQVQRRETRRYANFGDTLRDRQWAEKELERQHAIMTGEISPMTPVTPRTPH